MNPFASAPPALLRCLGLAGLVSLTAIPGRAQGPAWQTGAGGRFAPLTLPATGRTGFTLLTNGILGIQFTNTLQLEQAKLNNNLMNGAGVAAADYDGDGFCDLFFCNLGGASALFRNRGNWTFENVTAAAGVALTNQASTGAVFADLDGDGFPDLLVTSCGGPNACLMNDGRGHFNNTTAAAGLLSRAGSTSMALGDLDGDGDLDLYVANYAALSILRSGGAINMRMVKGQAVVEGPYADRIRVVNGRMIELGEPDALHLNDGRGNFTRVSWTGGAFLDEDGRPLKEPPPDLGLSVMCRDINGDGIPDLYVCNDFEAPDRIWLNNGKAQFRALPRLALRTGSLYSMSVDFADVNRDGRDDFLTADMLSRFHVLKVTQMGVLDPLPREIGRFDDRPQIRRNVLQLNRGDGTYAEIANLAGLAASDWTWCVAFLDVDLDGYEDVLAANGHAFDIQDLDVLEKIHQRGKPASAQAARDTLTLFPTLLTPNFAFRNRGDLTFEETGRAWGFASGHVSHGIAFADLDNDGDLDVIVSCLNAPPLVYRNDSIAPRVAVRLRGKAPNVAGIGASLRYLGGPVPQSQQIIAGGRYLSGDQPMRVFAAGASNSTGRIEVTWRNGTRSVMEQVRANHVYEVDEAGAVPAVAATEPELRPLFTDVTPQLAHRHQDEPFDDFERQPLLPHRLSLLGPGVAWVDLDRDGRDELVVGTGRGGRLAVYRHDGQRGFAPWQAPVLNRVAVDDLTGLVALPGTNGGTTLLAGRANYEQSANSPASVLRFDATTNRITAGESLPGIPSSTGPLALADIDGDGRLDLFVGGRSVPGQYPRPASSRLFRQDEGRFTLDETNSRTLETVGLVSGAVFSDLNGDGWPDLVLATEWGPLRVFQNDRGRLRDRTTELGFDRFVGWWNGVTTGDFDGDGRLDVIAGNSGLNSPYHASPEKPVSIVHEDFDQNGVLDLLEGEPDELSGVVVPRRDLIVLSACLPPLRQGFPTHRAFGRASLTQVLGEQFAGAPRVQAGHLASTLFLNRGDHFDARPLPAEAQWAPAFAVCVADADGDGTEDVFLSQNFFAVAPDMPRLDAGRGLWLRGDGRGGFSALSGSESGIRIYGEQRGAAVADYDADGRVDLAVTQNGAETRLFHNTGAVPGLRVRLRGPEGNPDAIGATLRPIRDGIPGAARELHAGSGYWSQDGTVQVFGGAIPPTELSVRWPGGKTIVVRVPKGSRDVTVDTAGNVLTLK